MTASERAHGRGKLIVFGEHGVVYGHPAVACGLPRGARATLSFSSDPSWSLSDPNQTITVDDDVRRAGRQLLSRFDLRPEQLCIDIELAIPIGAGLGSSAAMAVALARAAAKLCDLDDAVRRKAVSEGVAASEAVFHGNASGIDQRAATKGGFFAFEKGQNRPRVTALDVSPHRWIVARVAPSKSTSAMVESVADLRRRRPEIIDSIFDDFARVAVAGQQALEAGRWDVVGELMDINQGLLGAIGVSTPALERGCADARDAGAHGAKLTGAGGGGCIVALVDDTDARAVEDALSDHGPVFSFILPST